MKNKGFTLIELLGVIIILALLMIIVFPSIVNSVKNSSNKTDDLTKELIYNAADLFVDDHINYFPKTNGSKYVIELKDLVNEGLLTGPIKLSGSDVDITNNKCIQVTYSNGYQYELKEIGMCEKFLKCSLQDLDNNEKYSIGDVISCEFENSTENFYVMENETTDDTPETVNMLSMYNLYVGNVFNEGILEKTPLENPTGIQNELARGYVSGNSISYGTVAFSSTNYWLSTVDSYPSWIYNQSSNLYQYVSRYEGYLKENGVSSASVTLINKEQLESLDCSGEERSCSNAPEWVYSTTYWTGSAASTDNVWYVSSDGLFLDGPFYNDINNGIRPVVTISVYEI